MQCLLPFSGVFQSTTNHIKLKTERGHRGVNIRYTIKNIHASPGDAKHKSESALTHILCYYIAHFHGAMQPSTVMLNVHF